MSIYDIQYNAKYRSIANINVKLLIEETREKYRYYENKARKLKKKVGRDSLLGDYRDADFIFADISQTR